MIGSETLMSILMLAGIALCGGGGYLLVKKRDRRRGLLMLVAGIVMFANVAVWLMPVGDHGKRSGRPPAPWEAQRQAAASARESGGGMRFPPGRGETAVPAPAGTAFTII